MDRTPSGDALNDALLPTQDSNITTLSDKLSRKEWIKWGTHWLALGCFMAFIGIILADVTFLIDLCSNRVVELPSSVSEAMKNQAQTSGSIYRAFMLLSSLSVLVSFYPFTLPNASCRCRIGRHFSYRGLRWVAPTFFSLLVQIPPPTTYQDVIQKIKLLVHDTMAFATFFLLLWPEVHTLYCQHRPSMAPGELRGRKLFTVASIFFLSNFLLIQLLWILSVRVPILNMACFACEILGASCTNVLLLHIWHFNSRSNITAEELAPEPSWRFVPRSIFAGSKLLFVIGSFGLFVFHLTVVVLFWNPGAATMNCADAYCTRCLPGTEKSITSSGCNVLTQDAEFWSSKLGVACFCDGHNFNEDVGAEFPTDISFSQCRIPAYPYTVVTAPNTHPFLAITFQGCQVDDVRKLNDTSLNFLRALDNPVEQFSAQGLACARIPIDLSFAATSFKCDPDKTTDHLYRAYCVSPNGVGRALDVADPSILSLVDGCCHTASPTPDVASIASAISAA